MCGIVVQDGANKILGLDKYQPLIGQQDGMEETKAIAEAIKRFNKYKPRTWDDGKDAEEFEAFKDYIPDMILHAAEGVREAFKHANMIEGEYQRWHNEPKIDVPIMLYQDYSGGGKQTDLKCKPPLRNPPKKMAPAHGAYPRWRAWCLMRSNRCSNLSTTKQRVSHHHCCMSVRQVTT